MKIQLKKAINRCLFSLLAVGLLLVAGCTKEEAVTNDGQVPQANIEPVKPADVPAPKDLAKLPDITTKPVKLSVYYPYSDSSYDSFMNAIGNFIVSKYPNYSFEWRNTKDLPLNALAATNTELDLYYSNTTTTSQIFDAGFGRDMSDLLKKYNIDTATINPSALSKITKITGGEIVAMPYYLYHHILFYNRDIFDKFAEDYPTNHMTWDEVYSLARNLTRKDGDIQYLGIVFPFLRGDMSNPYGLEILDPKTNEVTFENGAWAKFFDNFKRFHEIPGAEYLNASQSIKVFREEFRLAMMITLSNRASGNPEYVPENWDMASLPEFPDAPGVGSGIELFAMGISSTSKKVDEAFAVVAALISEEMQIQQAILGRNPVIDIPNIEQILSEQSPGMKGRNISALFVNKFAPPTTVSQDVIAVRAHLGPAVDAIMRGEKDVNTAFREAAEKARLTLQERAATQN